MRRPRPRNKGPNVSLFPFLAVLICTMGALVVLLVIVVQQARLEAHEASDEHLQTDHQTREQLETLRDDAQWRLDVLKSSHTEKQAELHEERLRLAGLEDHVRRIEKKLQQLKNNARAIQKPLNSTLEEQSNARRNLAMLQMQLQHHRQELNVAKTEFSKRARSFSIIAYKGPNGTRRRPIFIECLADRVIIQPENVVLTESDFRGPLGPSNPLASALRSIREHHARYDTQENWGEPYPLLIVRPSGAQAYAAARRAMKSWDAEFGYELIDNEIDLTFPNPDPALAELLHTTVEKARQRQIYLAKAAPSRYGSLSRSGVLVASSRGGFELRGNSGSESDSSWSAQSRQRFGGNRNSRNGLGAIEISRGGQGQTKEFSQSGHVDQGQSDRGPNNKKKEGSHGKKSSLSPDPSDTQDTRSTDSTRITRNAASGQAEGSNVMGSATAAPIATSRGKNWGLPNSSRSAIGVTRPIHVGCYSDRLVVYPEKGIVAPPRVVAIGQSTHDAIDDFVSELWAHMEAWGIAGNGIYWKPILVVEVAPDAKHRIDELEILLDSSGIKIQRKLP